MGYQPRQANPSKPPGANLTKYHNCNGNIEHAGVVIVYGSVNGSIEKCDTVIVINGDVKGDVKDNHTVGGYLADKSIGENALLDKAATDCPVSKSDMGIADINDVISRIKGTAIEVKPFRELYY